MPRRVFPVVVTIVLLAAAPAGAVSLPVEDPRAAYAQCMDLARDRPRDGFGAAVAWEGLGGGEAARHCAATALFGLGEFEEAAARLEVLARDSQQPLALRLDVLAQAGAGWLRAGRPQRAEAVYDTAIDLAGRPGEGVPSALPGLLIDRATARADQGRDLEAARDLDRALDLRPNDAEALALRASTLRRTGSLAAARVDAEAALALDPTHPGALLELGNVARLTGAPDDARRAWMRLLAESPDSPEAAAARENLARLDVGGAE
jgi:tetratricopeptide (TPR) repeat protein